MTSQEARADADCGDRLRGAVAADPSLLDDPDRLRAIAARLARDAHPDDEEGSSRLERRLVALGDQLRQAGS